jgi:hypothetical protein
MSRVVDVRTCGHRRVQLCTCRYSRHIRVVTLLHRLCSLQHAGENCFGPNYRAMGVPYHVAALSGLLLLLLAGDAAATEKIWLGYRCYLPGCSRCENGNPYRCQECNRGAGYIKLADITCGGCACTA